MGTLGTLQFAVVIGLTVIAFGIEVFALVDAARTRADAFAAAGKLTKQRWLLILAVSAVFGFLALPIPGVIRFFDLLPIIAVVAAGVYLADVRPAVRQFGGRGGGGGSTSGPYGPW